MKITIHQGSEYVENEIIVNCNYMDERMKKLVEYISQFSFTVEGYGTEGMTPIPIESIYYLESVDSKTYLYLESQVYESKETLFTMENILLNTPFVRVSKSCLLNTAYLRSVKSLFNHRLEATLKNDEKVIISRTYVEALKEKIKA